MNDVSFTSVRSESRRPDVPGGSAFPHARVMKAFVLSFGFFAAGIGLLWSAFGDLRKDNRATAWPTTEGRIESSKCDHYYRSPGLLSPGTYIAKVRYVYSVAGATYHGSRIAFSYDGSSWQRPNQAIADALASAKTVLVRYDPDRPSRATLSYGLNGFTIVTLFVGFWFLVFAAVVFKLVRRSQSHADARRRSITMRGGGGVVLLLIVTGFVTLSILGLFANRGILSTLAMQ